VDTSVALPLLVASHERHLAVASREAHRELADNDVAGGATCDGLVALAARDHGAVLVTRDARARSTYETLGVAVEVLVGAAEVAQ
jgi:predicted nucleic acid-binding protein